MIGKQVEGSSVLDLFSGTGSLGLESLSRGCRYVYFVDKDIQSINLIRYNTKSLTSKETGIGDFKIIHKDVIGFLRFCNIKKWDIIFLDPPYRISTDIMKSVFDIIVESGIAADKTLLVYEAFSKKDIEEESGRLRIVKESFFGDKKIVYLRLKNTSSEYEQ